MENREWILFKQDAEDGFFRLPRAGDVIWGFRDKKTGCNVIPTVFTRMEIPDSFGEVFVLLNKISDFQLPCALPIECSIVVSCSENVDLEVEYGNLPSEQRLDFFRKIPRRNRLWFGETLLTAFGERHDP